MVNPPGNKMLFEIVLRKCCWKGTIEYQSGICNPYPGAGKAKRAKKEKSVTKRDTAMLAGLSGGIVALK
jgi:hypothetical protein